MHIYQTRLMEALQIKSHDRVIALCERISEDLIGMPLEAQYVKDMIDAFHRVSLLVSSPGLAALCYLKTTEYWAGKLPSLPCPRRRMVSLLIQLGDGESALSLHWFCLAHNWSRYLVAFGLSRASVSAALRWKLLGYEAALLLIEQGRAVPIDTPTGDSLAPTMLQLV